MATIIGIILFAIGAVVFFHPSIVLLGITRKTEVEEDIPEVQDDLPNFGDLEYEPQEVEVEHVNRDHWGTATTFKGEDITYKMLSLGAPALPKDVYYAFFDYIEYWEPSWSRTGGSELAYVSNALAVAYDGSIYVSKVTVKDGENVEKAFLRAAKDAHSEFFRKWEADEKCRIEVAKQEAEAKKIKEFVKGRTPVGPVLGEEREWVEDPN